MEFFGAFGWRAVVIVLAALIGAYALFIIVRLARVPRAAPAPVGVKDPAQFGEQVFRSGIEAEFKELREEIAALKSEIDKLKAARTVSPQYEEAVTLAQQGLDASVIAERCGISVAEAEMVRALSRQQTQGE